MIIKFLAVNIEGCCDTLTIGEGSDVTNRTSTIAAVFGTNIPKPLVIESSSMWLRFQSDVSAQMKGFQAEVQTIGTTGKKELQLYRKKSSATTNSKQGITVRGPGRL